MKGFRPSHFNNLIIRRDIRAETGRDLSQPSPGPSTQCDGVATCAFGAKGFRELPAAFGLEDSCGDKRHSSRLRVGQNSRLKIGYTSDPGRNRPKLTISFGK
jgi:hypothetical protein